MPVLVWGNGACSDDGTSAQNMLAQVASHGFVAIASGPPGGAGGSTTSEWMSEAIEWVVGGANGLNVDSSRIMAAGYSCGGTEAYEMEGNAAVKALGIFNSGLLGGYELAGQLTKPTLYALGGPDDIAYENVSSSSILVGMGLRTTMLTIFFLLRVSAITPLFRLIFRLGRVT
jgi:hypothetical protein